VSIRTTLKLTLIAFDLLTIARQFSTQAFDALCAARIGYTGREDMLVILQEVDNRRSDRRRENGS